MTNTPVAHKSSVKLFTWLEVGHFSPIWCVQTKHNIQSVIWSHYSQSQQRPKWTNARSTAGQADAPRLHATSNAENYSMS